VAAVVVAGLLAVAAVVVGFALVVMAAVVMVLAVVVALVVGRWVVGAVGGEGGGGAAGGEGQGREGGGCGALEHGVSLVDELAGGDPLWPGYTKEVSDGFRPRPRDSRRRGSRIWTVGPQEKKQTNWRAWIIGILVALVVVVILQNSQTVAFEVLFASFEAPLIIVLAVFVLIGMLIGYIGPVWLRHRRDVRGTGKEVQKRS
jgi:uncharacterized integral membrane protein